MANRSQLGAVALIALAGITGQVRAASVTIVATSTIGDQLTPEIRLHQGGSRTNVWPAAHIQTADTPHGCYEIEVFNAGFRRFSRELEIGDEHIDVRVVLSPSMEITGALERADKRGK